MLLRQRDNDVYADVLRFLDVEEKFGAVIKKKGDTSCFDKGLFGATEMFVDSLGADFRFNGLKARQARKPLVRCTACNGISVHFQIGSPA